MTERLTLQGQRRGMLNVVLHMLSMPCYFWQGCLMHMSRLVHDDTRLVRPASLHTHRTFWLGAPFLVSLVYIAFRLKGQT